jgi:hypothetical protein
MAIIPHTNGTAYTRGVRPQCSNDTSWGKWDVMVCRMYDATANLSSNRSDDALVRFVDWGFAVSSPGMPQTVPVQARAPSSASSSLRSDRQSLKSETSFLVSSPSIPLVLSAKSRFASTYGNVVLCFCYCGATTTSDFGHAVVPTSPSISLTVIMLSLCWFSISFMME